MVEVLSPRQLEEEGKAAFQAGVYNLAIESFKAAEKGFILKEDVLAAAEMANNLCVALLKSGESESALEAVEGTDTIFASAADFRRQAMALGNQASVFEELGRIDEAISDYQKCADLLEEIADHELRSMVMQSLSSLQLRAGRPMEALATMRSGVEGNQKPKLKDRIIKKLLDIPARLIAR